MLISQSYQNNKLSKGSKEETNNNSHEHTIQDSILSETEAKKAKTNKTKASVKKILFKQTHEQESTDTETDDDFEMDDSTDDDIDLKDTEVLTD